MSGRFWCAFSHDGLAITSTLTRASSQVEAEAAIFARFANPRDKMEAVGVHVAAAIARTEFDVIKDSAQ